MSKKPGFTVKRKAPTSALVGGQALGQRELRVLEVPQRLAEHLAVLRVLDRQLDGAFGARDADDADLLALVAQLVDDVLDRPQHRAERDHDRLGVLGAVGSDESAGVAAELLVEFRGELWNQSQRPQLFVV